MQIVRAVERVEVQRSFAFDEPAIGLHRRQIRHHRVVVVAAQHVDVAGHVYEMAGVGNQVAQQVGRRQRLLRVGRHLHGVQVQVQDHRVLASGGRGQRVIEDPFRLDDPRARRRLAGAGVPQRPRGDIEQRIGGQRLHVDVVGIRLGQLPPWHRHRRRGRPAARRCHSGRRWGSGPAGRRSARVRRHGRAAVGGQAELHPGPGQRRRQVDGVERLPRLVVVGPDAVGDTPPRDREVRVELQGTVEAADRLLVVERVGPDQPTVEPDLRLRRGGVNRPVIGAQVVVRFGLAQRNGHDWHDNSAARTATRDDRTSAARCVRPWPPPPAHTRRRPRSPA